MRRRILSAFFCLAFVGVASAQRLPRTAVPENYRMTLAPNFDGNNFTGDETIAIQIFEPTSSVTLNALELEFRDVAITSKGKTQKAGNQEGRNARGAQRTLKSRLVIARAITFS